jgi:Uma2 family endonuclease
MSLATAPVLSPAPSTLPLNRKWKKRVYAAAGISAYWIVNLRKNRIEVYTQPQADNASADFQQRQDYSFSDTLPVILDGKLIGNLAVADLLA